MSAYNVDVYLVAANIIAFCADIIDIKRSVIVHSTETFVALRCLEELTNKVSIALTCQLVDHLRAALAVGEQFSNQTLLFLNASQILFLFYSFMPSF